MVCQPRLGKHLCFDGRLLHAAPADLPSLDTPEEDEEEDEEDEDATEEEVVERITFLVNVWVDHVPLESRPYHPTDDELREFQAVATGQHATTLPPLEPDAPPPTLSLDRPEGGVQWVSMPFDTGPHAYRMNLPVPTEGLEELCAANDTVRLLLGSCPATILRVGGTVPLTDEERAAVVQERRRQARRQQAAASAAAAQATKRSARAGSSEKGPKTSAESIARRASTMDTVLTARTVKQLNPKSLKAELRKRGLSAQGNKTALRARLLATVESLPSDTPSRRKSSS